ncbi:MAG: hypothetical protein KGL39_42070 [Patescibacteria group bacterium]|nr:hypothetical protein [Patescibacteria group bacterium]
MRKSLTKIDLTGAKRSIARHTVEVGDCVEWTAYSRGATPQMRVSLGDGTSAGMYVRRAQSLNIKGNRKALGVIQLSRGRNLPTRRNLRCCTVNLRGLYDI